MLFDKLVDSGYEIENLEFFEWILYFVFEGILDLELVIVGDGGYSGLFFNLVIVILDVGDGYRGIEVIFQIFIVGFQGLY